MTRYMLAAIAGIWMADGLSLVFFPSFVVKKTQDVLSQAPQLLRWEIVGIWLGLVLLLFTQHLPYQPLWWTTGTAMVAKGWFMVWGPPTWRDPILRWCLTREAVDYRFVGVGLCALAVLLLHAVGLLGEVRQP
jgi:hypothetical protein